MKFTISAYEDGQYQPLATVSFDNTNRARVKLAASGPVGERFRRDWDQVAGLDEVDLRYSEETTDKKGREVVSYVGRRVARNDPDFPEALLDYFSQRYGYLPSPL